MVLGSNQVAVTWLIWGFAIAAVILEINNFELVQFGTSVIFQICTDELPMRMIVLRKSKKTLNFGPKLSCLVTYKPWFWKAIAIFETSTLKLVQMQSLKQNKNTFNSQAKITYLGSFIKRNLVILEIRTLKFFKMQTLNQNKKTLNSGPKLPYLVVLCCNLKETLSYLKAAHPNLSKSKILNKIKILWTFKYFNFFKFESKSSLWYYFWTAMLQTYCHIWN